MEFPADFLSLGRGSVNSVGNESTPQFNIGPCGRGFELSRR